MVDMMPVKSSNIESIGYDADKRELHVKFKSGGHYIYEEVESTVRTSAMAADSIGGFLHSNVIRGPKKYKYRKVINE